MLEPREADIPALFLVLVVLPLVAYFLLGKWSESAKKRERISLLAHLAAQEARRAEAMAVADVIPPVAPLKNVAASTKHVLSATKNNGFRSPASKSNGPHSSAPKSNGFHHACARCFSPAMTRCAKCKSVRYCSGKCQIIHWREVHKQECGQMDFAASSLSPLAVSIEESFNERILPNETLKSNFYGYNIDQTATESTFSENIIYPSVITGVSATVDCLAVDTSQVPTMVGRKSTERRTSRKPGKEALRRKDGVGSYSAGEASSKESQKGHKSRKSESFVPEECAVKQNGSFSDGYVHGRASSERCRNEYQHRTILDYGPNNGHEIGKNFIPNGGNIPEEEDTSCIEQTEFRCSSDTNMSKGSTKPKRAPYSLSSKSNRLPKSTVKESVDQFFSERDKKGQVAEFKSSKVRDSSVQASNEGANGRIMKMIGLGKSTKLSRRDVAELCLRTKMLFPYDEFMKFFQCEVYEISPRGLLNCGNSCYANAVLQCLTSTKPLIIYLLHRSHSRACCGKDWCLMCELEQHVTMLREIGGPLSPSRILLQMRSINCHIGDGNQEDAHEFLRLLVASMQAICLEGLGGENKVDPRLQETTFIQHTFGGHLRSKVKCLRCHHESERYENIMDLTLEIYGWVESLEDALTQFTTPEDLDGENMYRCGRCTSYVRARKQLSIHEAPNILTIVLKRFQEGRYGKINKCITFPDMLDMIPFMTGTGDAPPLYLLYAVVVHLDTLNASFSGHYVSYVKDLQGNWYRIDDTEVQPVPMSQVMSEGAYILFYMRSCPRPHRAFSGKVDQPQAPQPVARNFIPKPSRAPAQPRPESGGGILRSAKRNSEPMSFEFSDAATSSDWSLFTSSDDASFTTESTRDSFSTDFDPASSIFATPDYVRRKNHNPCRNKMAQTRFFSEEKGHILDSYLSAQPLSSSPAIYSSDGVYVRYGSNQNAMGLN